MANSFAKVRLFTDDGHGVQDALFARRGMSGDAWFEDLDVEGLGAAEARCQRGARVGREAGGDRVHAASASRWKILSSFSLRVTAVKGLMM